MKVYYIVETVKTMLRRLGREYVLLTSAAVYTPLGFKLKLHKSACRKHAQYSGSTTNDSLLKGASKLGMACVCIHVACWEHDQGHSLTAETELNWAKLIHFPAEIFPRAPGGKSQLHLTSQ